MNWLYADPSNYSHASGGRIEVPQISTSRADYNQGGYTVFPQASEHTPMIPLIMPNTTSDNAFAAAQILQQKQQSVRLSDRTSNQTASQLTYGQADHGGNVQNPQNPAYELNSPQTFGFGSHANVSNESQQAVKAAPDNKLSRKSALDFGSDEHFRGNYLAPKGDAPDRELASAFAHNFTHSSGGQDRPADLASPRVTGRKRPRWPAEGANVASSDEDEGQSSDVAASSKHKRRKSKIKYEGVEGFNMDSATNRSTKRARGVHVTKEITTPSRGRTSPPSSSKAPRENLTEEQKRSNHIQSEQKRRNLIKQGFEDLNRTVPDLRSGGLSKSAMLHEAAKFMKELQDGNVMLRARIDAVEPG